MTQPKKPKTIELADGISAVDLHDGLSNNPLFSMFQNKRFFDITKEDMQDALQIVKEHYDELYLLFTYEGQPLSLTLSGSCIDIFNNISENLLNNFSSVQRKWNKDYLLKILLTPYSKPNERRTKQLHSQLDDHTIEKLLKITSAPIVLNHFIELISEVKDRNILDLVEIIEGFPDGKIGDFSKLLRDGYTKPLAEIIDSFDTTETHKPCKTTLPRTSQEFIARVCKDVENAVLYTKDHDFLN